MKSVRLGLEWASHGASCLRCRRTSSCQTHEFKSNGSPEALNLTCMKAGKLLIEVLKQKKGSTSIHPVASADGP